MYNRFTHNMNDFKIGDRVWLFYTYDNTKKGMAEGILDGRIIDFKGYALNIATIRNKAIRMRMDVRISQLNKIKKGR